MLEIFFPMFTGGCSRLFKFALLGSSLTLVAVLCAAFCTALMPGCQNSQESNSPPTATATAVSSSPSSAEPQGETLSALQQLALPQELDLKYSWAGLAPEFPEESYHFSYLATEKAYQVTGQRRKIKVDDQSELSSEAVQTQVSETLIQHFCRLWLRPSGQPELSP